jgi:mannose-6-phosphate isomerase-like protein (cupin superfamily)
MDDPKRPPGKPDEDAPPGLTGVTFDLGSVVPFRAMRITVASSFTTPLDCHQVRECWIVASGRGVLTCDGSAQEIAAGDFLYFESFRSHQVRNDGSGDLVLYSLWWQP